MAFRDWPVDQQEEADALSGVQHKQPIQAFLVSLSTQLATLTQVCSALG